MTDGIVEMQDKLITSIHNKARKRYEDLLRATEEVIDSAQYGGGLEYDPDWQDC